ncbi:hypothetical protein [Hymenobacter volaticus]|uniref:MarR family transcriptional regulator n=1 Tax=Hymenobacter volaticus TaxID=2932254 RepID=A0ABY4GDX4_9BACT|nr:hypothetical protein [Hymenobacter volaticus]UOQ69059.1 hypothetical protein MUN86_26515 [Hymenobacter volaticus]
MLSRLQGLVQLMRLKRKWRSETYYVLEAVFLKGSIARREVERLTGLSDKTAKILATQLVQAGLLATETTALGPYRAAYPIGLAPALFPGLYTAGKEIDMLNVD